MILWKDLLLDMPFNFICILFMIFLISKYAIENNLLRVYYENTLIHKRHVVEQNSSRSLRSTDRS